MFLYPFKDWIDFPVLSETDENDVSDVYDVVVIGKEHICMDFIKGFWIRITFCDHIIGKTIGKTLCCFSLGMNTKGDFSTKSQIIIQTVIVIFYSIYILYGFSFAENQICFFFKFQLSQSLRNGLFLKSVLIVIRIK